MKNPTQMEKLFLQCRTHFENGIFLVSLLRPLGLNSVAHTKQWKSYRRQRKRGAQLVSQGKAKQVASSQFYVRVEPPWCTGPFV